MYRDLTAQGKKQKLMIVGQAKALLVEKYPKVAVGTVGIEELKQVVDESRPVDVVANSNKIGIESSDVKHIVRYEGEMSKVSAGSYNEFISETATTFRLAEGRFDFKAIPPEPARTCCISNKKARQSTIIRSEKQFKSYVKDMEGDEVVEVILIPDDDKPAEEAHDEESHGTEPLATSRPDQNKKLEGTEAIPASETETVIVKEEVTAP